MSQKLVNKNFELYQVFAPKFFNTFILHTTHALKALLSKIIFISFLSSPDMQKFHHFLGSNATSINSSFNFFLGARCV